MKKIIAIIAGGDSSEHDVSLRSAAGINSWLDRDKFIVYTVEISSKAWEAHLADGSKSPVNRHDFSFMDNGEKITPDYAYITIHGTPGEDGILQGYFDLLHIPYSTSNVLVEAMTFNKFALNQYLKSFGIRVADSMLIREGQKVSDEDVISHIGLPCFIKPNAGGSSFGVTKVKTPEQIQPAIEKAMKESPEVLIESMLVGTEIANGVYNSKSGVHVLPITEVVSHNEFFDYDAKYNGAVEEITPARLSDETTERVKKLTAAIYGIIGASGLARIDYIISHDKNAEGKDIDIINLLEINTTPGMTATSFIPQQAAYAKIEMKDMLNDIIAVKLCRDQMRKGVLLNEKDLVQAALCHDLGMVGRENKYKNALETCKRHPIDSAEIAKDIVPDLSPNAEQMILSHMWPLSTLAPQSREGRLLCRADKYASMADWQYVISNGHYEEKIKTNIRKLFEEEGLGDPFAPPIEA